jgi:hypothetical protein
LVLLELLPPVKREIWQASFLRPKAQGLVQFEKALHLFKAKVFRARGQWVQVDQESKVSRR